MLVGSNYYKMFLILEYEKLLNDNKYKIDTQIIDKHLMKFIKW